MRLTIAAGALAVLVACSPAPTPDAQPTFSRSIQAEPPPARPATPWFYIEDKDQMSDVTTRTGCTTSKNMVRLNPPYSAVQAQLCIRRGPPGDAAYVRLMGDGQILCDSYHGCRVPVRFDDAAATSLTGRTSADYSSNVLFLTPHSRLIAKLKGAKTTRVQLGFYEAGEQVIEFNTENLEW